MNHTCKQFGYLSAWLILMGGHGCSSYNATNPSAHQTASQTNIPQYGRFQLVENRLTEASHSVSSDSNKSAGLENTVTVTVYKVDNSCQTLKPETLTGPEHRLMSSAVDELLNQQVFASLGLVGYRLKIDRNQGIATVDLRAAGNSRQKLQNLSSCQMLGLLGGVRQTLTSYAPWQVKTVRFTELGEDMVTVVRE
ncbi:MAG: hypothetical protein ACRC62_38225 [Microcoleus sp.]